MQTLEEILKQVESLRKDLSAEIVLHEEISEQFGEFHTGMDIPCTDEKIIQPRITRTDVEKRADARQKLIQIFNSSGWHSVSYVAGKALGIEFGYYPSYAIDVLKEQLNAEITEEEQGHWKTGYRESGDSYAEREWIIDKPAVTKPDLEKRQKAKKDLDRLILELRKDYNDMNFPKEAREQIGKTLGYSSLRIWAHENPVKATISGIATSAAASGLGYMLYQYMTR